MSLDVDLMVVEPVSQWNCNITHNLNTMAAECHVGDGLTLYNVLWRPDEHGLKFARDLTKYLEEGYMNLDSHAEKFRKFNPENGWGSYEGLVKFVYNYWQACLKYPDSEVRISR
jgi:hypothetical protein